jgi:hypothetical protein
VLVNNRSKSQQRGSASHAAVLRLEQQATPSRNDVPVEQRRRV